MDPRPAPWRVFELADTTTVDAADDPTSSGAAPGGPARDTLTLPMAWTAAAAVLAAALVAVVGFLVVSAPHSSVALPESAALGPMGSAAAATPTGPVVEVSGAVVHPGVYRLASGARVADAISAAGGYSPRVDAGRADRDLDLARPVSDGEEIQIPSRDDPSPNPGSAAGPASGGGAAGGSGAGRGPLDLNTATAAELDALPGIGPVTAAKIVASRQAHPFRSVGDLQTRKLVGPATFEKLRGLVVVH